MPRENARQRRRRIAAATGITNFRTDFTYICKRHPDRIGIVTEGDSWFAYPRKWVAFGADINIVHHVEEIIQGTDTANLLRMACNGDEAINMMSGRQKEIFENVLSKNAAFINLILFSGGGNDIVGKRDMLALLNTYEEGFSAQECINSQQFENKLNAVMLAYEALVDIRNRHTPNAKIVVHAYDIAKPSKEGASFFWGLIKTKPWISPYLVQREIPEALHLEIVEILLGAFKDRLQAFTQLPQYLNTIFMVDTQGILRPGNSDDWLNEIHPTEDGFKKITIPIYQKMKELEPSLPDWH